jgi:Domain of unknown function (DUF4388)
MQGNLNTTDPLELLQALGNRNSPGLLRVRPGDEAQIYVAANGITHAAYRTLSGVDALVEVATWRNDEFRFEENNFSFTRSLTLAISEAVSKLQIASALRELRPRDATGSMYFYSNALNTDAVLSPLETSIVQLGDGVSIESLVRHTGQDAVVIAEALKHLMELDLLSSENIPCTPEKLRSIRPRFAPPPKFALFSRPKQITLEPFVLTVYDQIDGGRTLWDIHLNLGCSRQAIWDAFNHLQSLKLVVNAA